MKYVLLTLVALLISCSSVDTEYMEDAGVDDYDNNPIVVDTGVSNDTTEETETESEDTGFNTETEDETATETVETDNTDAEGTESETETTGEDTESDETNTSTESETESSSDSGSETGTDETEETDTGTGTEEDTGDVEPDTETIDTGPEPDTGEPPCDELELKCGDDEQSVFSCESGVWVYQKYMSCSDGEVCMLYTPSYRGIICYDPTPEEEISSPYCEPGMMYCISGKHIYKCIGSGWGTIMRLDETCDNYCTNTYPPDCIE